MRTEHFIICSSAWPSFFNSLWFSCLYILQNGACCNVAFFFFYKLEASFRHISKQVIRHVRILTSLTLISNIGPRILKATPQKTRCTSGSTQTDLLRGLLAQACNFHTLRQWSEATQAHPNNAGFCFNNPDCWWNPHLFIKTQTQLYQNENYE